MSDTPEHIQVFAAEVVNNILSGFPFDSLINISHLSYNV